MVRPVKFVAMSPLSHLFNFKMILLLRNDVMGDPIVWNTLVTKTLSGAEQSREKSGVIARYSTQVKLVGKKEG